MDENKKVEIEETTKDTSLKEKLKLRICNNKKLKEHEH